MTATAPVSTSLVSSGITGALPDNSATDIHLANPRPVPYEVEQRYSRLPRDGLVSRREKSMTHFQEESQPLRINMSGSGAESVEFEKKWSSVDPEEESKLGQLEPVEKLSTNKSAKGLNLTQLSSEDEDICPTCLEGNNILQKILKLQQDALTIIILVVFMNGWKEAIAVLFVARKWSFAKAHSDASCNIGYNKEKNIHRLVGCVICK
ncbi:hypothetical protein EUGRSUZ_B03564 [Eucalyptus grandis]|uniref:Uncharacterized protein n=2 Tax=Eucalyptus grandis TaxID=71139 RepID=A0A059D8F6_EUCGR|nr:hypothetical protein EUGRSUZ_B03564 [Eucalyptus grandis]